MIREPNFGVGTKFRISRMHPVGTVIDVLKTYSSNGELVYVKYVCSFSLSNNREEIRDDIEEPIISKGLGF